MRNEITQTTTPIRWGSSLVPLTSLSPQPSPFPTHRRQCTHCHRAISSPALPHHPAFLSPPSLFLSPPSLFLSPALPHRPAPLTRLTDVGSGRQEGVELLRRMSLVGHRDEVSFASLSLVVEAVFLAGEGRDVVVGTPRALQVTHVHLWGRRLQRTPQRRPKHLGVLGGSC